MKLSQKILNLTMAVLMFLSPLNVFAADISEGASKGDLRLNTYKAANKNKIQIEKTDSNGVSVRKTVTKKSVGTYNVEFSIKGPITQVTSEVKLPVYVVFVIDRSYSMRNDSRWTNAEAAAINISKEFSKLGVNMAAVGFSGGRTRSEDNGGDQKTYDDTDPIRESFSTSAITDFGNYDTDYTYGGGTNMYAGLYRAQQLLNGKDGVKHIILLTDGVPTFYYDDKGYTKGPGNSNTDEKIAAVPAVITKTINLANKIKNTSDSDPSNDITIHTIGYHLDKLTYKHNNLKENELAKETLQGVSTSSSTYHLVNSNSSTNVSIELGNIKTDIMNLSVANNPKIVDGIGAKFKLSNQSYGGSKTLSKSNYGVGTSWQSLGSFDITIDPTVPTGWYETNNDFTFSYDHITKGKVTKTYNDNPEVYWTQPVPYTIYHVEKNNISNVLKTESDTAELKDVIKVKKDTFKGYTYDSQDKQNIVIDESNNVAYVYYVRNNYDYQIIHVEKGNPNNVFETESGRAAYQTSIAVNKKTFKGYTYDSQDKQNIVIDDKNNIAYVYYVKAKYDYQIIHMEKGNPNNVLETEKEKATYQSTVPVNKKTFKGYTYDSQDKQNIVIDDKNNIAYVYYVKNNYDYQIIHMEKGNPNNVFETESGRAAYNSTIKVNKKTFKGYTYDSQDKQSIVIDDKNNIAYVYYVRNNYDYQIIHMEKGNLENVLATEKDSALYEDIISVNKKTFDGYTYDSQDKDRIVIDVKNNIAYVYYVRNNYDYQIIHVEKDNLDNVFEIEEDSALYEEIIPVNKKTFAGFTYDSQDKENIVIDLENNIAYVYYVRNEYDYQIVHVEKDNSENILETEEDSALYEDIISVNKKEFKGYTYDSQDKDRIVIDVKNNIAYVYYVRNEYDYQIIHVEKDNLDNVFEIEEDSALYKEVIPVDKKTFKGYVYDSQDKDNIIINLENNIAYVYYVKRSDLDYVVNYLEKDTSEKLSESKKVDKQIFGTKITSSNEIIDIRGYKYHSLKPEILTIHESLNVIDIYYTKLIGDVTAIYIDTEGNTLEKDEYFKGMVTDKYETKAKDILEYELVEIEGKEKGEFIEGSIIVKYIYEYVGGIGDGEEIDYPEIPPIPQTNVDAFEIHYNMITILLGCMVLLIVLRSKSSN